MKKATLLLLSLSTLFSSGCATIFGGSKYYAHVVIVNNEKLDIYYQGELKGKGDAAFKVKRKDANDFTVILKKENCPDEITTFSKRRFRWWFLLMEPWLIINYTPIPIGFIIDGATGAYWKPSTKEKGVSKMDYRNYRYNIIYNGCKTDSLKQNVNKDSITGYQINKSLECYNNGKKKHYSRKYTDAIINVNKAIELNPYDAKAYNLRGLIKYELKDYNGALDDYNNAIALDPNNAKAYENRGDLKHHLYDNQNACIDYNKAVELGNLDAKYLVEQYCK